MYLLWGILFLILITFFCINLFRRKKIIKKIRSMCMNEKCSTLDRLIEPFGYAYVPSQDLFTSRLDAWQRDFGYCTLYDKAAYRFHMIFDCLPVYFNYHGRTWLIEFWKGQYGINTGCEIGVYYADRILREDELETTLFKCAEDKDMLKMSFYLIRNHQPIAHLCAKHWWLTAFAMGCFSDPSDLSLHALITFPSVEMAVAFACGLDKAGCKPEETCIRRNEVTFNFEKIPPKPGTAHRLQIHFIQRINHFWCRVYLSVTDPFCLSVDRLLYLYYYLPFAFRKMLRIRKYKKTKSAL